MVLIYVIKYQSDMSQNEKTSLRKIKRTIIRRNTERSFRLETGKTLINNNQTKYIKVFPLEKGKREEMGNTSKTQPSDRR